MPSIGEAGEAAEQPSAEKHRGSWKGQISIRENDQAPATNWRGQAPLPFESRVTTNAPDTIMNSERGWRSQPREHENR